jgi:hypothetical protein
MGPPSTSKGLDVMTQEPGSQQNPAAHLSGLRCVSCNYDLRDIPLHALCPECGKPVADSLSGDAVERTDPAWAMGIAQGITWYVYYVIAAVIYTVLLTGATVAVTAIQISSITPGGPPPSPHTPLMVGFQFVTTATNLLLVIAYMLVIERMTRQEPNRAQTPRPYEPWRMAARLCIPVILFFYLAGAAVQIHEALNPPPSGQAPVLVSGTLVLAMGLGLVGTVVWGLINYVTVLIPADLAMRIQDENLQRQARRIVYYFYGLWGSFVAMMALSTIMYATVFATGNQAFLMGGCIACVPLLAVFVLGLSLIIETVICYPKIASAVRQRVKAMHPEA